MGVHIRDSKLVRRKEPKTNSFDLSKNVDNDLRHEIDLIIKHNELLAVHRIKYCPNANMETTFMKTESIKTNKPHKFVLNLSQRLDLKSPNNHVALQNTSIHSS